VQRFWAARKPVEYVVHLCLVDRFGNHADCFEATFLTGAEASSRVEAELDRLRTEQGYRLGGERCWCYEARVESPDGWHRTAYLFSVGEPVQWDDECDDGPWE
jgi:hypothetical protein